MSLKIAKINLNSLEITGYKDKGDWYISESELAKLINVPQQTTNDFFNSKWLKSFLGKDYTTTEKIAKPGGGYIKAVTTEYAFIYITYQCSKNNPTAIKLNISLGTQNFDMRFESNLDSNLKVKASLEELDKKYLDVQSERERQKQNQIQNYFQMWCEAKGMNPAYVHDYITTSVIGRKAKDSRELPLYSGINFYVGLDHYQENENEEMSLISQIKDKLPKKFPRKKKDYNYKNYVDDVIQEITV